MSMNLVTTLYLIASVCFIQALKGLSHPTTSIRGNVFGMTGMAIAMLTTGALIYKLSAGNLGGLGYVLVALVSPENVERPDFNFEIGAALGLGKQIVSVVPRGFDDAMLLRFLPRRRRLVKQTPEKTADELLSKAA